MKKKTELGFWQNLKILAKTFLISLLYFICQWQVQAMSDIPLPQDSTYIATDSVGISYHRAWSFPEGYEDEYLSLKAFSYEEIEQENNWLERVNLWIINAWERFLESIWSGSADSGFWRIFFQLAPYILLVALMGLLVYIVIKYNSKGGRDIGIEGSALSADEALLKNKNLRALADEALKNQNYRLALRYRYLMVLQHLIQCDLIVWKSSKTNFDYQKELRETRFLEPFTEVTRIYNFVWYGHLDLDAASYGELEGAFNHLDQLS